MKSGTVPLYKLSIVLLSLSILCGSSVFVVHGRLAGNGSYGSNQDGSFSILQLRVIIIITRALLRLERTMNLLEGGREGKGGWGREGGEGTEGGWGERVGRGRGGERECVERGRVGREGGWGESEGGEGRGGEGRGGEGRGGEGRGGMTVIDIVIGMFTSNPMIPQYFKTNLT